MSRRKHTPEEKERRAKICELLQMANIGSMDDIGKADAKGFSAVTVAAVIRFLALVVVFTVAEFGVQLRIQAILHKFGNGFLLWDSLSLSEQAAAEKP